jgi:hypothetical protein
MAFYVLCSVIYAGASFLFVSNYYSLFNEFSIFILLRSYLKILLDCLVVVCIELSKYFFFVQETSSIGRYFN